MNNHILQGNWNELKGKIKSKWAKLTDEDVDSFQGDLDQLKGKIQKTYGYGKDRAETEFNDFMKSVSSKVDDKGRKENA